MTYACGSGQEIVTPDDFNMIEHVFRALLHERKLGRDSEEAEIIAARLIELYRSGIHDQAALKQMARYL
ncbi:hypothetical protein D3C78_1913740 [compost metagenome]